MTTPVCDFLRHYEEESPVRMHMPGHKGIWPTDITEIPGADILYSAGGILRESEENAAALFGSARTLYSTEGSSLCIRAMLYLAQMYAAMQGKQCRIAAGRNAHRVFSDAAALMDPELIWIGDHESLLQCSIPIEKLEELFSQPESAPTAIYLTSPDYLGHRIALREIAELCHRHNALLLTDNAHGAYLKFLPESLHPLEEGADLICDSAHKTLPVLTGGAYLHASISCPPTLLPMMERAMALFASTSPSYLILQSLDAANALLDGEYPGRLAESAGQLSSLKLALKACGWELTGEEPMKLTLCPKSRGYTGYGLAGILQREGIFCEFADPDYLVLMPSAETTSEELEKLRTVLCSLPPLPPICEKAPTRKAGVPILSLRETLLRPYERISTEESEGRILAAPGVSCPPAVPILLCGERIDRAAIRLFQYYGIREVDVIRADVPKHL